MSIDLSQFHQVFFEESFENLDIMENSLMELDISDIDSEIINTIFRAAHSIKGGSATFGFSAIAEFTHILETLLDQIRAGDRGVSKDDVNLFLQSVDCIREMLSLLQSGEDAYTSLGQELTEKFTLILNGGADSNGAEKTHAEQKESEKNVVAIDKSTDAEIKRAEKEGVFNGKKWTIFFHPEADILKTGNDPMRLVRELGSLGKIQCHTRTDNLPTLDNLDSELNYLYWEIDLHTEAEKSAIESVFEWVSDESVIDIKESLDDEVRPESDTFWFIAFLPHKNMLKTGNDPLRLINVLADFGQIKSVTCKSSLPDITDFDPENCYLQWEILLDADETDREKIDEVFEWVVDEADITIKSVSGVFNDNIEERKSLESAEIAEVVVLGKQAESKTENLPKTRITQEPSAQKTDVAKPGAKTTKTAKSAESSSIRVGIDKVDNLINMVGELVITQSMLGQLGTDFDVDRIPNLLEGLSQLEHNTRELQESVMRIRMLPISFVFSRFPRMVRDLSQSLSKDVNLKIIGDQTELDKTVLEKIGDPLVHLVRNAVDHGIETPDIRQQQGKNPQGTVTLNAYHQGGNVVIEVVDDGKGLDINFIKSKALEKEIITPNEADLLSRDQIFDLIFQPGFSTAEIISDVSGRGVGMDVVKRNIQALNGVIDLNSEVGVGSTITIRLPLTLAILDGQLVRVSDQTYIFPIVSIAESLQCKAELINKVAGGCDVFRLREEYVPIIQLAEVFNIPLNGGDLEGSLMVVVESEGEKVGIVVDELLAQQQVVIKSLEQNYKRVNGVSGATILGDGTVALIVDIPGIVKLASGGQHLLSSVAAMQNQQQIIQQSRL